MTELINIDPLDLWGLVTAVCCGAAIGLERQWSGKPAGIRTSILVCLGAYTFIALTRFYQPLEDARVLGQVVTGVGFLGAGVMLTKDGLVHGVTSAAVIWILAAIGAVIGFGNNMTAIALAVITLGVLIIINFLEKAFSRLKSGVHEDTEKEGDDT